MSALHLHQSKSLVCENVGEWSWHCNACSIFFKHLIFCCCVIRKRFGKQVTVDTKLRLNNITPKSALSYGSEMWILNGRDTQKLEAARMRFSRPLLGFTRLVHQRNTGFREKRQVINIVKEIQKYQQNLKDHLQCMDRNRLPKLAFRYQTRWRTDLGRPKRRWKDQDIYSGIHRNRPYDLNPK